MVKVTIKPSEQIIREAAASTTVKDSTGREIMVRKLSPLDRMRMSKAAGAANSTNQPYMLYALVAYSTVSIDGATMVAPTNELQLEAAISRLGDEGYEAALEVILEMYSRDNQEEIVEAAKK